MDGFTYADAEVIGPRNEVSKQISAEKYYHTGEDFPGMVRRVAGALSDDSDHFQKLSGFMLRQEVIHGGRILSAAGSNKKLTANNCYVAPVIEDSLDSIFSVLRLAALTLQQGGGIGYDFSNLRPMYDEIVTQGGMASGPVSFMHVYDAMCGTLAYNGRRGAQMGLLRCDHPDIRRFINAKQDQTSLTNFNISVGCTGPFLYAVENDLSWDLVFNGKVHGTVRARDLWNLIMENNWKHAEPGVVFIDRVNEYNNLYYCEKIYTTNPSMPAGTLVHSDRGVVRIETMENETFKVKAMDGTWAEAKCFLSSANADVLEIDFGGGRTVRCTPEHKWPVLVNGRYVKVLASELVVGDQIPTNRNEPMGHNVRQDLTYTDGLVAGMAFGDGSYNVRSDDGRAYLQLHCNKKDTDLQDIFASYFSANISENSDESVVHVSKDNVVREFVEKVGLTFGDKSKLPATVWQSNDDFVAGFVDGLFSTDGCVCLSNKTVVLTNKEEGLIKEVGLLLAFHGILSTVRTSVSMLDGKAFNRSDLTLARNSAKRFLNVFKLSCSRKMVLLEEFCAGGTRKSETSTHLTVQSVTKVDEGPVWDISVYHHQHVFPTEWVYTGNCGEQGLPPNGSCLLGALNVSRFFDWTGTKWEFNYDRFTAAIHAFVPSLDNVIDRTGYPLPEQLEEAKLKRRMGVGVMGMSTIEVLGHEYGSSDYIEVQSKILETLRNECYRASINRAKTHGAFPLFDRDKFMAGKNVKRLPLSIQDELYEHGIRNGTLTTIAPTGTTSLSIGDNVAGGIEPVFSHHVKRKIRNTDSTFRQVVVTDYMLEKFGVYGTTANEVSANRHVDVLTAAQYYIDSAISKTINYSGSREDFDDVYMRAYKGGAKGCSTFNINGFRDGILEAAGSACTIDPDTGHKTCS